MSGELSHENAPAVSGLPGDGSRGAVRVFAPASVSNVACGFDTLGFAVEDLGDLVLARSVEGRSVEGRGVEGRDDHGARRLRIAAITGEDGRLPRDTGRNTAAVAATRVLELFTGATGERPAIELEIHKRMPLSSGLGSSAASAVGGAVATHELLRSEHGFELTTGELLECALAGELVASGGRHADNVAPCLLGGFVLVRSLDPEPDVVQLPACDDWLWCALARPELAIETLGSRQRLGTRIALPAAIRQWANVGALVAALYRRDPELLSRSLEDHVAEPVRRDSVPGFTEAMAAAREAGALGGSLSGSGPTLFALCTSAQSAAEAAEAMAGSVRRSAGVGCTARVSRVGVQGAHRLADPGP